MAYCLPPGYRENENPTPYIDAPSRIVYQPHVYELGTYLARRSGARWLIDVGCGSGGKLAHQDGSLGILAIDNAPILEMARAALPAATLVVQDLEAGLPALPDEVVEASVVICADVVEHLANPTRLMEGLAQIGKRAPYVLVSTPDRDRARGIRDSGPPENPAHVREWSASEFLRFCVDSGFPPTVLAGHTINSNIHRAKTTTLVMAGREAVFARGGRAPEVTAIVNAYNESDMLEETANHLLGQGVSVHVIDNWSTDGSYEIAQRLHETTGRVTVTRFPDQPTNAYQWARQLDNTARIAAHLDADWVLHCDADELRLSPWPGVTLAEALGFVGSLGYDAVDHTVIDFRFLRSVADSTGPYETSLNLFEFGRRPGHFLQVKGWRNGPFVDLSSSGGHEAAFENRRVFPLKFLTKHYPLRSRSQANRKVFQDRLPRFAEERERGWHHQYDVWLPHGEVAGWDAHQLCAWHPHHFYAEYLVERISGIGLLDRVTRSDIPELPLER